MSTTAQTATDIRPFHVDTAEEKLAELRRRIAATRLPSGEMRSRNSAKWNIDAGYFVVSAVNEREVSGMELRLSVQSTRGDTFHRRVDLTPPPRGAPRSLRRLDTVSVGGR